MLNYRRIIQLFVLLIFLFTLTGCWSSKEIEDSAIYAGLALDISKPSPVEKDLEEHGGTYSKNNKMTVTVQIVPVKSTGSKNERRAKPLLF